MTSTYSAGIISTLKRCASRKLSFIDSVLTSSLIQERKSALACRLPGRTLTRKLNSYNKRTQRAILPLNCGLLTIYLRHHGLHEM
jgi:hypothetical protein